MAAALWNVGGRAGAEAGPGDGFVAPQRLDGECGSVVALDVAHRAGNRRHGRLSRQTADERLADPGALVAVLVGVDGVVPTAEVRGVEPATEDVLGSRVGHRLLDLVAEHDRDPVELAGGPAVDCV